MKNPVEELLDVPREGAGADDTDIELERFHRGLGCPMEAERGIGISGVRPVIPDEVLAQDVLGSEYALTEGDGDETPPVQRSGWGECSAHRIQPTGNPALTGAVTQSGRNPDQFHPIRITSVGEGEDIILHE
jgi:hypothetical protein